MKDEDLIKLTKSYIKRYPGCLEVYDNDYEECLQSLLLRVMSYKKYLNPDMPIGPYVYATCCSTVRMKRRAVAAKKRQAVVVSLDDKVSDTEDVYVKDIIPDEYSNIDAFIDRNEYEYIFILVTQNLSDVYLQNKYCGKTMQQIADERHVSKQSIAKKIFTEQKFINDVLSGKITLSKHLTERKKKLFDDLIELKNYLENIKN